MSEANDLQTQGAGDESTDKRMLSDEAKEKANNAFKSNFNLMV